LPSLLTCKPFESTDFALTLSFALHKTGQSTNQESSVRLEGKDFFSKEKKKKQERVLYEVVGRPSRESFSKDLVRSLGPSV